MKRIISYLFLFLALFTFGASAALAKKEAATITEKQKVTLYLFRLSGCSHCADEMKHLKENTDLYKDKIDIVVYNVSNKKTMKLAKAIAKMLGSKYKGAPYNIIGSKEYVGYSDTFVEEFDEFLEEGYNAQEKDVVSKLLKQKKYKKLKSTTLDEAIKLEEEYEKKSSNNSNDKIIIIAFIAVVLVSILAFVINTKRYDN